MSAEAEATDARHSVEVARTRADEAEHAYEHAMHRDAAARAAEGKMAGDPCPVCDRVLPDDFRPPKAAGIAQARAARANAAKALEKARKVEAAAEQSIKDARELLGASKKRRDAARHSVQQATDRLTTALGVQTVDLGKPSHDVLASLTSAMNEARSAHDDAVVAAEQADRHATTARDGAIKHAESVKRETSRVRDLRGSAETSLYKIATRLRSLPDRVRPDLGDTSSLDTFDREHFVPKPVVAAEGAVAKRLAQLAEIDKALDAVTEEQDEIRRKRDELDRRIANEVKAPRDDLAQRLTGVAATLKSVGDRLGGRSPAVTISADDLDGGIERIGGARATLIARLEAELIEQQHVEAGAAAMAREILAGVAADDLDDLADNLTEVEGQVRDADKRANDAERAVKAAKQIDEQLGVGDQLVKDLDELRTVLGKFTDEVLSRRSQALLAVAGQRLSEMTGDRFAFTGDFQVLDTITGQPRGTDTLSGGESFLASLALALGMVDLAARAGGRLDALFLDEGFGALDNINLSAAIDALEATAAEGRMVGVISHVKGVADRIEDVLLVVGGSRGSRVVWLDEAERSNINEHDLAVAIQGLLD